MKLIAFTSLILTTYCGMFTRLIDTKSEIWLFICTAVLVNKRIVIIRCWLGKERKTNNSLKYVFLSNVFFQEINFKRKCD